MAEVEVLCVGSVTLDTIAIVDGYPEVDSRVQAAVRVAGGGPAATAAVTLARLGVQVGLCGVVGDDESGRRVRAELEREGVDTRWLTVAGATAQSVVIVTGDGSRTILAGTAAMPTTVPVDVSSWVHVDQTGYTAVRAAGLGHARLSIDGGNTVPDLDLTGVDLYAPTLSALGGTPATATAVMEGARERGAEVVIATDGARGCWVADAAGVTHVAPFEVQVRSTLGAGDVFHGALLAGLISGDAPREAATRASAAAALSCRAIDGRSAIPSRAELDRFLAEHDRWRDA